ncbi:LiaG family protein [Pseudoneobacillus sp. C159]
MKKVIIAAVMIAGVYILFFQSNVFSWWSNSKGDSQSTKITNRVDLIEIDVSGASTTIIPVNGSSLRAELDGKGKVTVDKKGDTVKVKYKRRWIEGLGFLKNTKLTVYIPEDYNERLHVDIGSGNFKSKGFSKNKSLKLEELSIDLGSGNVDLEYISAKRFVGDVSSGNVKIDSLITSKGSLDISSGNVNLKNYRGELVSEISSGNLDIEMDKLAGDIKIEISSGKASLDLPKNADFKLNAEVNSGLIRNDFDLENYQKDKHSIKGKHGSGKYDINLDVSSGIIEIH